MPSLLDLPDELISNDILKYLAVADLWRLGAVCHKFNDEQDSVVHHEFKSRDEALVASQQYPQNGAMLDVLNSRQRILSFERCSSFAWEMTRQAQRHDSLRVPCTDPDCPYPNLHSRIPILNDGLRNKKNYFFFALFTNRDTVLWQGFLQDNNPESDFTSPIEELINNPDQASNNDVSNEVLINEGVALLMDFQEDFIVDSEEQFHLNARNVTTLTRDHMDADLRVTLVSLSYDQEKPELQPSLRLHYSAKGLQDLLDPPLNNDLLSMHILSDQYVMTHRRNYDHYATPFLLWATTSLHSFSMLYNFDYASPDLEFGLVDDVDLIYDDEVDVEYEVDHADEFYDVDMDADDRVDHADNMDDAKESDEEIYLDCDDMDDEDTYVVDIVVEDYVGDDDSDKDYVGDDDSDEDYLTDDEW